MRQGGKNEREQGRGRWAREKNKQRIGATKMRDGLAWKLKCGVGWGLLGWPDRADPEVG